MKKLFLVVAIFGGIFLTSCEPVNLSEIQEQTLTEGEDGEIEGEEPEEEEPEN